MEEEHRSEGALRDTAPEPRYRGSNNMYRGVTISVKALTGAILAGLAALALAIVFLAGSGGFTVTFETDGGSQVPAQTCRYGELGRGPPGGGGRPTRGGGRRLGGGAGRGGAPPRRTGTPA